MPDFIAIAALVGLGMLVWDCVEVGRNDAANLVNAVFGARVMARRTAVILAAVAVVLGATFSSSVMETARKGIFNPSALSIEKAICVYISVYFVHTVMLYAFSAFGMPVSTTACLVFALVGASLFLAGPDNVVWPKVGSVAVAIVVSIVVSALVSFLVMRVFRGAIRDRARDRAHVLLHGPWIAGAIFTWLSWFMIFKGLKNVPFVKVLKGETFEVYGEGLVLIFMWGLFTLLTHLVLTISRSRACKHLFAATAVLGMVCMAFAFGQNDLANAASPGLSSLTLWLYPEGVETGTVEPAEADGAVGAPLNVGELKADKSTTIEIPWWALFGCGVLIASGMFTTYAQRVTRAEVNMGSQFDHVALYAPGWCKGLARWLIRLRPRRPVLAPPAGLSDAGKKVHYDTLRASVITGVSASVIAFASGHGLPVSTTYVAFAAVLGTGLSDRVFARGDSDLKLGRAIWVMFCWLLSPLLAIVATGCVVRIVYHLSTVGLVLCIFGSLGVRWYFHRRADIHEQTYHIDVSEKMRQDGSPAVDDDD
jgi:phosphate/sulfate permease